MFETVRNWGAAIVTSAPSTTMIATRLSSRCRARMDSNPPRVRATPTAAVAAVSAMGDIASRGSAGGRGVVAVGAPGRGEHHPFLGGSLARDLSGDSALVKDEDPIGHREVLRQVARDEDDPEAGRGKLRDDPVHLDLGTNVDPTSRLVEDEDLWIRGQPLGQDDLLLIAAGQRPGELVDSGHPHVELLGEVLRDL